MCFGRSVYNCYGRNHSWKKCRGTVHKLCTCAFPMVWAVQPFCPQWWAVERDYVRHCWKAIREIWIKIRVTAIKIWWNNGWEHVQWLGMNDVWCKIRYDDKSLNKIMCVVVKQIGSEGYRYAYAPCVTTTSPCTGRLPKTGVNQKSKSRILPPE